MLRYSMSDFFFFHQAQWLMYGCMMEGWLYVSFQIFYFIDYITYSHGASHLCYIHVSIYNSTNHSKWNVGKRI